ncbi:MAG: ABC transporter permease subunit [Microcoleaceae cyanobacterium]
MKTRNSWRNIWLIFFFTSLIWSFQQAGIFQKNLINQGGWNLVISFLVAATHPEISPEFLLLTLDATIKTLAYAVCGTFFSVFIGSIGGLFSSEVWWQSILANHFGKITTPWLLVRGLLAIPRAIHELIWGLFFLNIFGLDPLVGILAIAIPFGTITAKVFSEILDETPRQPLNALLNSGATPLNAFAYSLIPQAFLNLLSYSFYRFECSIRSAAVLGIIGAGGLGYQIRLSLESLRYEQVWTLLVALIFLTGTTDFWSGLLRRRLGAPSRLDLNAPNKIRKLQKSGIGKSRIKTESKKDLTSTFARGLMTQTNLQSHNAKFDPILQLSFLGGIILLIFCFWYIQADFTKLWSSRTAKLLANIVKDAFPPDISQLEQMFTLSCQTLAMSILAITIAGVGGIFLSFPAANNFLLPGGIFDTNNNRWGVAVLFLSRLLLLITRATPEPILALLLMFVLFPGILPGAIALGLHNLGILGRLMAEVTENLDQRPLRSLKSLGATTPQIFLYGVLPSTMPRFLAYILYRWEVCIRGTVIVGIVGAGGLGRLLTEQLSSFDYSGVLTTLFVFICLTFLVDLISAAVRRCLR